MLTIALFLIGCSTPEEEPTGGDPAAGEALYASSCAGCHGADGEGVSAPAMTDAVSGKTEEDLIDVILNGSGDMPAMSVSEDEAADIAAYALETWGG